MKKKGIVFRIFSIVLSILLLLCIGLLIFQLIKMNFIPTNLLAPISVAIALVALIFILLLNFFTNHFLSKFFISLIVICLCVVGGAGNFYLYKTSNMIDAVTTNEGKIENVVSVISMSSSDINDLNDLSNKKVATLKSIDTYGTKQSINDLCKQYEVEDKKDLPFEIVVSNSVQEAIHSLYNNDVDAIILNETYRTNVLEMESYTDFDSQTKVIYQTTYYTESKNEALAVSDITNEPFNILVSGNDTYGDVGELSRSDVNMVVTINPQTSTILLTSIPRDTYMATYCDYEDACVVGAMDKITHTGIYGINTTQKTVENFLGIEINYTFRANFSSVIDIVDALGGVDVYVEPGMAVSTFYADHTLEGVVEGWNHLDGKRALAYARERHAYLDGDNQRVRNQQQVLMAIFEKATSKDIITKYSSLLEALSSAFETNLTMKEITDLIKFQIQAMPEWKFESYQISGYGDMALCAALGSEASVTVPYDESVRIAQEKISAVLQGYSSDTVEDTLNATESEGALSSEEIDAQVQADLYAYQYGYYY
ncbi:MAG: LCP family protein [Erysipelotrichaceae bacterium]|uniref:LCP family protein n=1 Tax=Floccifex sp. TaxID=2815810 RepID=UPI002A75BE08|nr:LCP family protein [Floccifex sp.]MDD7280532.1 LCP family protein [Erysipelotrichaceae bacterium]MDY2959162.1 LCP family protein [Floccifex sp.]